MPFIKIDEGVMEEFGVETEDDLRASEGKFDYANASADLKAAKLSEVSRALLSALKDLKATHFRVAYDGGHDEGFSYPESVKVGPTRFDISEVSKLLAARPFLKEARAIPKLQRDYPASLSDIEFIRYALDELAYELASTVLGEGFGTGEYELYGAFTVDLHTGQMEDDPDAQPRHIL